MTETNAGSSARSSPSAFQKLRSPSSVFGGKNSKEKTGSVALAYSSSIRMEALEASPPLRLALHALRPAGGLEVREVGQRLVEPPAPGLWRHRLAVDVGHDLERGPRLARERALRALDPLVDERAVGVDVRGHVGERAAVAGQAQPRVARGNLVQRREELAGRVGRPAEVAGER